MLEILAILIFNVVVFFPTINYGLVMDDLQHFKQKRENGLFPLNKVKSFGEFRHFIEGRLYSGTTFGTNPKVEHCFKIFLNCVIAILMYLDFGHNQISFWAAMMYSCHPLNNQTSMWLNGRRYSVNIILVLLMIAFPILSPLFYLSTGLLQVTAFFSPILMLGHSWAYLLLIPVALALGWKHIINKCESRADALNFEDLNKFTPKRSIISVKIFGFYFFKMLIPGVCSMEYPFLFFWGLSRKGTKEGYALNAEFYKGVVAMVIYGLIVATAPSWARFYAIFMGFAIIQWCAIIPFFKIVADRYASLPNVFMMFFVSYALHLFGSWYIPLVLCLMAYYLICFSVVMPMYKDIMSYYLYHIQQFPSIPWPRTLLINDLMTEGKKEGAQLYVFDGLKHNQTDYSLLMWGAVMCLINHKFKECETFLDECEKNMYVDQEEKQKGEIENMRKNLRMIKPVPGYKPRKIN